MKHLVLPVVLLVVGVITTQAQTIIPFSADQPDELQARAGNDTSIWPGSSIILGDTIPAAGGSEPYSFTWKAGSSTFSTEANPVVNPETDQTYTLLITDADLCTASDFIHVHVNLAEISDFAEGGPIVYPNPARDQFTVDYQGGEAEILLLDEKGNLIWRRLLHETTRFPTPEVPGIYLLKLISANEEILKLICVCK